MSQPGPGLPGPAPARPGAPGPGVPGPGATVSVATVAAERLANLAGLPVAEHVAVFDEVHRLLQDALATLDQA